MKIWINWETQEVLSGASCVYNYLKDIETDLYSSDNFLTHFLINQNLTRADLFRLSTEQKLALSDDFVRYCQASAVETFEKDFEQIEISTNEPNW